MRPDESKDECTIPVSAVRLESGSDGLLGGGDTRLSVVGANPMSLLLLFYLKNTERN